MKAQTVVWKYQYIVRKYGNGRLLLVRKFKTYKEAMKYLAKHDGTMWENGYDIEYSMIKRRIAVNIKE